ncbi:CCE_0567 family metalloprotein [Halochromatium glycolicum]|jgi:hypothetical protein|uniref:Rop-like n=1 Tax=Halochromatium glycolicum TaxID=85075 RepID=A0AAJ0X8W7_9GAMM|nr:CCE_0567 family metalloprotein [Halochromatium glycolicum]MBK1703400.1 hypothetical protein [Halochromatium glycolicum]
MTEDDLKALEKATKKAKRIASERASELHDLVEDRLPAAFEEIPAMAQATYDACQAWSEANARLKAAQAAAEA